MGTGGQRSRGLVGPETINLCLSISFALQYLKMKIKPFQSFINSSTNFFLKVSGLKISSFLFLNVLNHPVSSRFDSTLSLVKIFTWQNVFSKNFVFHRSFASETFFAFKAEIFF